MQTKQYLNRTFANGEYWSAGKLLMENRRKMLLAIPLLIVGALVIIGAYVQNVTLGYPIGLALALLGSIFWLLAE